MDLERTRADWTALGAQDPLWAVLVTPEGRHDGWDPTAFLATGRDEVSAVLGRIAALGLRPGTGSALDFGCGAGRLTQALRDHVERAVGIDFSEPMLERARSLDVDGRCEFVHSERPDLSVFGDATFDIAYSSLVLQHIPTAAARGYLAEMVRVVRPGGVVAVQVATRPDQSLKGRVAAVLPRRAMRFAQRRLLGYPAPMDMYPLSRTDVEAAVSAHGRIAAAWDEPMYGGHWVYTRYVIERA
ncbi:Methyltransferase domain-containing protein [Pedococcus cremeus]|uniref:Methyltransferase domain-containing protein n=1 Tax=Pedococcus cremeus TaxID=587636 RepID=A0A1H9X176_9MICO|nr:class I SAM-dependent methyltransferase [Pedococcus cremeus]SES39855.1 Methyltransferase domain-containing protein [Pedococcus cremeus]